MKRTALVVALLFIACGGSSKKSTKASGGAASRSGEALPVDSAIRVGKLDNGLTYYVRRHETPRARASLWLAVNAGSVLEAEDQRGLAHFVEHMAFNGTKKFKKQEIVDYLERIGMKFGPDVNAYTSFDETVYQLQVPTDDAAIVDRGLDVLHEWAEAIAFDPAEVEKERGVVLEEWRLGRGAQGRMRDKQFPILFAGSRYAVRLPIGEPKVLKAAPVATLHKFYTDWYRPELMAVIAVGDFDPAQMEVMIKERFADLKNPAGAAARESIPVRSHDETKISIETDPELPNTTVQVVNKMPARPKTTAKDYRRMVVEGLFHGMLNARLVELSRKPSSPFLFAGSSTSSFVRTVDSFNLFAAAKEGKIEAALEGVLAEVERVERHGFTAGELARQKASTLRSYNQTLAEKNKQDASAYASEIVRHFLQGETMPGIAREVELLEQFLPTIGLDELNGLAKGWNTEDNRVILVSGPQKKTVVMPTSHALLAVARGVESMSLDPYKDETSDKPLLASAPTPGKVVKENHVDEIGVTVWTLSNGARVVLKPTDFRNDEVVMTAFSPGGHSVVSNADFATARFASDVVGLGGVGAFNQNVLRKALSGKVASASAWIGELEEGLRGRASPKDLETMFQLMHLRFTAPRKDSEAFAAWKVSQADSVRNRELSPERSFFEKLQSEMASNHPRRLPTTEQSIDAVDLDKAHRFYRDRFADAGDFTFIIVGTLDMAKTKRLVETYIAGLPTTGRKESWKDIGVKPPRGVHSVSMKKGKEAKSFVYSAFHGDQKWSPEAEDDITMLQEFLRMRLREVLREDMSGVYGVFALGSITRRPRSRYGFAVGFSCAPANVDKLKKAVFDVVGATKKSGAGDDYIAKIKEARRRAFETNVERNGYWLRELATHYRFGTDPVTIIDANKRVARVSRANIRRAARRYLKSKQYVDAVLMPE